MQKAWSTTRIARLALVLVVGVLLCAGALTRTAGATDNSTSAQYFDGWLSPQQGASTAHAPFCVSYWASTASWDAVGWRVKVVLIFTNGQWISAAQSTDGTVETYVDPDAGGSLKAHCKNNEDIYAFSVRCFRTAGNLHNCV
jgi:hypothetical protein